MKKQDFDVTCSQTLCKNTYISTENYIIENDKENNPFYNTSEVDFEHEFVDQRMTPLELINELYHILMENPNLVYNRDYLLKECSDWEEIETTIIED